LQEGDLAYVAADGDSLAAVDALLGGSNKKDAHA
jgi:hypothetical protein